MAKFRKPKIPNFDKVVGAFVDVATEVQVREVKKFAEDHREKFARRIMSQRFDSFKAAPLSPRTQQKKRRLGLPLLTMVATKTYVNSIAVHDLPYVSLDMSKKHAWTADAHTMVVGIDPALKAKEAESGKEREDVTLQDVARIHEYGAPRAHIPRREHWRPYYAVMREEAAKVRARIARLAIKEWKTKLAGT
jgi:hypothetical protein